MFGRIWQVNVQAETSFRDQIDDIYRIYVRNAKGNMVPMRALAEAKLVPGPADRHTLQRLPRRGHQRRAEAGLQFRPGARRDGAHLGTPCRPATATNGPAPRCRRRRRAARPPCVLGLAVLFAYLFLVALYESWNIPIPALLSVSVGVLGAIVAVSIAGLSFDVYAQIGLVVLVALAAKNGISDRRLCRRAARLGKDIKAAAIEGARIALPPGDDDQLRLHLRPVAAGHRQGRRRAHPPRRRHAGIRRHDRGLGLRNFPCPAPVYYG